MRPRQADPSTAQLAASMSSSATSAADAAQSGKKVFISADMEGISGISGSDQLSATGAEYSRSRKMMADDVNAAIRGARAGGATTIVVNDSHGSMRNLRLEDLEPGVALDQPQLQAVRDDGRPGRLLRCGDLRRLSRQGGASGGLFAHTGSGVVRDVRVNGQSLGEGGLNTTVAAWYGVPVALVTGDDVAVKQVAEVATTAKTVAVKRAINPRAVELRPFKRGPRGDRARGRGGCVARRRNFAAAPGGELQGRSAVPGRRDPGSRREPARHAASGARHHRRSPPTRCPRPTR